MPRSMKSAHNVQLIVNPNHTVRVINNARCEDPHLIGKNYGPVRSKPYNNGFVEVFGNRIRFPFNRNWRGNNSVTFYYELSHGISRRMVMEESPWAEGYPVFKFVHGGADFWFANLSTLNNFIFGSVDPGEELYSNWVERNSTPNPVGYYLDRTSKSVNQRLGARMPNNTFVSGSQFNEPNGNGRIEVHPAEARGGQMQVAVATMLSGRTRSRHLDLSMFLDWTDNQGNTLRSVLTSIIG